MSQDNQILSNETPKASRRAILTAAPAAVAGALLAAGTVANAAVLGIARTDEVDPIFAVIAEHRTAVEEYNRAVMVSGAMRGYGPNKDARYDAAHAATNEALYRTEDALWDVLTAQPTTLAGIVALLAHVGLPEFLTEAPEFENETVLSTCTNADEEMKQAAQDFPALLAETMRDIMERGRA
jgi:hypothetical protein